MDFRIVVLNQKENKTYSLDLYGDVDVNVVFNITDIRNPELIKSNFTKEITIPATHNNNKVFESLLYNGNYPTEFNPNFKLQAQLYGDNTILIDGYLQVTNITKNEDNFVDSYDIIIYGELTSLFTDLASLKVSDLDFSEYNHVWNWKNIEYSWDKNIKYNNQSAPFLLGRGYVYPFEWRGQTTNEMNVEDFFPAIYVKTIWDKIFKKAGKTYTSNFINSKEFKSLILPYGKQHIYLTEEQKKLCEFEAEQSTDITLQTVLGKKVKMNPLQAGSTGNIYATFDTEISDDGNVFDGKTFYTFKKQFTQLGANIKVKIGYNGSVSPAAQWQVVGDPITCNVWLYDIVNKKFYGSEVIEIPNPSGTLIGPGPHYSEAEGFVDYTGIIPTGTQIRVILNFNVPSSSYSSKFIANSGQAVGGEILPYLMTDSKYFNAIQENYLFEGDEMDMNQIVPEDLTITDFLTSLNKMFNLFWVPDGDKNFIIEPRDAMYTKSDTQILDWTDKTNRNTDITITPLSELNNKKYLFTYTEGDDYYNETYHSEYLETYGEKNIEVLNDFVEGTTEVKPKFQDSVLVQMTDSERVAPAFVVKRDGFYERTDPKLRILYYGGLLTTSDYFLFKSADYPNGLMKYSYPYAGHYDNPYYPTYDINYGQCHQYYFNSKNKTTSNLFNKYWINTIKDIISVDSHLWAGELHLKPFDIITLNLFDTIQMDQVFYKINKIDYNPLTELAKVELIKSESFLSKPNSTVVKPDVIKSSGTTSTGGATPWSPWGPPIWEVDGPFTPWNNPFQNPSWTEWQFNPIYNDYHTFVENDFGSVRNNSVLTQYNNKSYTTTKSTVSSIHRNNFEEVNFIKVSGKDNFVSPSAYSISVQGNENTVLPNAKRISIQGNNNIVENGVENVSIIGDNVRATESNVSYINGVKLKSGGIMEEFDVINGSVNQVESPYPTLGRPNLIRSGRNTIQLAGGMSRYNYVNGGINTIAQNIFQ